MHRCLLRVLLLTFVTKRRRFLVSTLDTMPTTRLDLLQGTLDLLILRTLTGEPRHGWAISERIQQLSQDVLRVNQGSLYPALHRLEHQGWIASSWGVSELGRRARFYRLTAGGRKQLEREADEWARFTSAVGRVLRLA
jgi:PadR family transcriptional regulator PadR